MRRMKITAPVIRLQFFHTNRNKFLQTVTFPFWRWRWHLPTFPSLPEKFFNLQFRMSLTLHSSPFLLFIQCREYAREKHTEIMTVHWHWCREEKKRGNQLSITGEDKTIQLSIRYFALFTKNSRILRDFFSGRLNFPTSHHLPRIPLEWNWLFIDFLGVNRHWRNS